jgi:tetratricopeptide (TPR) repeat protein
MFIAEMSAEEMGRFTASLIGPILLALGVAKCLQIGRRPATNSKCVWSLALVLIVGVTAELSVAFGKFFGNGTGMGPVLIQLLGLFTFSGVLASIVFAVRGLIEYKRGSNHFSQGRAQAIWALVFDMVFIAVITGNMARGYPAGMAMNNQPRPRDTLQFSDLNFQFVAPDRPWVRTDPKALNAAVSLAFLRGNPEMYFTIAAEKVLSLDSSAETLADLAWTRLQGIGESVEKRTQFPAKEGALNGLELHMNARLNGLPVFFVEWLCATNGWSYQLTTWGPSSQSNALVANAHEMMSRFSVADYEKRSPLVGQNAAADYVSNGFGYRVNCERSDWLKWPQLEIRCPWAAYGALHRNDACLAVTAIALGDLKPEPEAIYRAFFHLIGAEDELAAAHSMTKAKLNGVEAVFQRELEGKSYSYKVRALQGDGFAYFVAAWTLATNPNKDDILAEAVARVELLSRPATPPDPKQLSTAEIRSQRLIFNAMGLAYYNAQRYEDSAPFFQKAVAMEGTQSNMVYLANFALAEIQVGAFKPALDEINQHPAFVESQTSLRATRAFLESKVGENDAALKDYEKLFAAGYTSESHFAEYLGLLVARNQIDQASTQTDLYLKRADTPGIRLWQAELLKRSRKFDAAITLLREQHEKTPFFASLTVSLADALIQAGRPNEALPLCDELDKQSNSSAAVWKLRGRCQFALKWYREAKVSFQNALKLSPSDNDSRQYLQALAATLGEGARPGTEEHLDPVPLPMELSSTLPPPSADFGRVEGAYYKRQITAVSFRKGSDVTRTEYANIHILSSTGVAAFSAFQMAFSPLYEELWVNSVRVTDAAGNLVNGGKAEDNYVLDDSAKGEASGRKILNIPVPGLEPGCDVELSVTRREMGPVADFPFFAYPLSGPFPTQEKDLYLTGETNGVRFASSPSLPPEVLSTGWIWREKEPPVVRWEPLQPSPPDFQPMIWLNDAKGQWRELVTNYLASIADRLALPADQQELARHLTVGATNQAQKIAAIANYIQTNYTYRAIEFGRRARMPQSLVDFTQNKYGDCKDHAVLAQQMLKAAGIPSTLVLVNSTGVVREDLPSLDQFDHMIIRLDDPGSSAFLDCSSKSFHLMDGPYGLAGHSALLLDAISPRFEKIPAYGSGESSVEIRRVVQPTNETDALVRETVALHGLHAGLYRAYYRALSAANQRAAGASLLAGAGAELKDFKIEGLDDTRSNLLLTVVYLTHGEFQSAAGELTASPPVNIERSTFLDQNVDERGTPFEISIPLTVEGVIEVLDPSQGNSAAAPPPTQKIENEFVSCQVSTTAGDSGYVIRYHVREIAGRFPPQAYVKHGRAMREVVEALAAPLVFSPKSGLSYGH